MHIAVSRSSGTLKLFINGTQEGGNATFSGNMGYSSSTNFVLGRQTYQNKFNLFAFVDEVRVTKGVARYTSNFTPQSREFYPGTGVDDLSLIHI